MSINLVRVSKTMLINPADISFVEQVEGRVTLGLQSGRMVNIETKEDLDTFFKELDLFTNNLWGKQHFAG